MKITPTIGQHICAVVIAHQLGISIDRALKMYVQGTAIDPSWEMLGQALLRAQPGAGVPESLHLGPQLVPSKPE